VRPSSSSLSTNRIAPGFGRATGDVEIHLDRLLQRHGMLEQRRHAVRGHAVTRVGALDVDPLEQRPGGDAVAHRRHVAGHGAIAERDDELAAGARRLGELEVVLAADGAFDHCDVHAFGPLLRVDERAEHDVRLARAPRRCPRPCPAATCGSRSSRRASKCRSWPCPSRALPHRGQATDDGPLSWSSPRPPSPSRPSPRSGRPERTCRSWCRLWLRPTAAQLGDEPGLDATAGDVPDVRALDLGAGTHAARAEDAAVVVQHEARVRGVDRERGKLYG
jgi:hypothetical protein